MQTATIIGIVGTANLATSLASIGAYTVPASTGAVISHLFVANTSGSAITATVVATNGTVTVNLAKNAPIAVGDTLVIVAENAKITLATGWSIQASASAAASADASMSVTQFV
jgi:hypothetical protein